MCFFCVCGGSYKPPLGSHVQLVCLTYHIHTPISAHAVHYFVLSRSGKGTLLKSNYKMGKTECDSKNVDKAQSFLKE